MANTKKRGRGRPQKYPVTPAQERRILSLVEKGKSASEIAEITGLHEFAVLRVRRSQA
jgi:DNA-binding CsgD family transcriptional regulator